MRTILVLFIANITAGCSVSRAVEHVPEPKQNNQYRKFFEYCLIHECGHAHVARQNGMPISEINVRFFGGNVVWRPAFCFTSNHLRQAELEIWAGGMASELRFYPNSVKFYTVPESDCYVLQQLFSNYFISFSDNILTFVRPNICFSYKLNGDYSQFNLEKDLLLLFVHAVCQKYFISKKMFKKFNELKKEIVDKKHGFCSIQSEGFSDKEKERIGEMVYKHFFEDRDTYRVPLKSLWNYPLYFNKQQAVKALKALCFLYYADNRAYISLSLFGGAALCARKCWTSDRKKLWFLVMVEMGILNIGILLGFLDRWFARLCDIDSIGD